MAKSPSPKKLKKLLGGLRSRVLADFILKLKAECAPGPLLNPYHFEGSGYEVVITMQDDSEVTLDELVLLTGLHPDAIMQHLTGGGYDTYASWNGSVGLGLGPTGLQGLMLH